jgi:hypothetical protein
VLSLGIVPQIGLTLAQLLSCCDLFYEPEGESRLELKALTRYHSPKTGRLAGSGKVLPVSDKAWFVEVIQQGLSTALIAAFVTSPS